MRRLTVALVLLAGACDVGSVETGGSGTPDASTGGGGGGGGGGTDAATGGGASSLSATFTTTPKGGTYAPKNIVAVWIEDSTGAFVKTIGRWADVRKASLVGWNQKAGAGDADAVSGATRANHTNPLTVTWNLQSKLGTVVPDGTYTIRMELADSNATATTQNNEGTFTFVKGTAPQMQTALSNGGFNTVSITFTP